MAPGLGCPWALGIAALEDSAMLEKGADGAPPFSRRIPDASAAWVLHLFPHGGMALASERSLMQTGPFQIAGYCVEPSRLRVTLDGVEARLEAKAMLVLVYPVRERGARGESGRVGGRTLAWQDRHRGFRHQRGCEAAPGILGRCP